MADMSISPGLITFLHICVVSVFSIGLLCFFLRKDFIRQLVGLKLMLQSVSLGFVITGWQQNNMDLAQGMIFSALVIEAVVMSIALSLIVRIVRHTKRDADLFAHLKSMMTKDDGQ